MSPSAAVLSSAKTTLSTKTADLQINMTMDAPGVASISATGNGSVDFANDAAQVSVQYNGLPQLSGTQMSEIVVGGNLYVSMPLIPQVVAGKSWVSEPLSGASSLAPGSSDPSAVIQMLTAEGDSVTPLGPSTVGGVAVHGYQVTINPATVSQDLAHSNLPPSDLQQLQSMLGSAGIELSVYVGDSDHLLREVTFSMHLTVESQTVTVDATETFSNYGTPVSITPPPADEVTTLQDYQQAASSVTG